MGSIGRTALVAVVLGMATAGAARAADPLAERLIGLRGEVEQLNSELELLREEQRAALSGLNAQRAELKASADRQQLLARDAQAKLDAAQAEAASHGADNDLLRPALLAAIEQLDAGIAAGLPFKIEQRRAELAGLAQDLNNGSLPAARAVNRLWAFYEDELRLTRENGLHNQTIEVGGEHVLAEVAKLGSVILYFRTPDGRYGQAVRAGNGWQFVLSRDEVQGKRIAALFDALRKQIRQGWFELPMLAATGAAQ